MKKLPIPWRNKGNLFLTHHIHVFQKYLNWRRILGRAKQEVYLWILCNFGSSFVCNVACKNIGKMKHMFFVKQNEKFPVWSFVFLFTFISYLIKGTTTSCLLLLSEIMETHRAISIEGLDLQVFDLSMRQIIWTR